MDNTFVENTLVGYRFSPTEEELIYHYLNNKILDKPWIIDAHINEINICAYDPELLPSWSKLKTDDLIWYFFSRKEYYSSAKKGMKRTTPSGFWKVTGPDRKVKDWTRNGVEMGIKKTLVYHRGKAANGVRTPWVIHEYHTTSLPLDQRNYVICKVMYNYKGEDGDSLYGSNSNELSHSTMVSDLNTVCEINTAPQVEQPRQDDLYMSIDDLAIALNEQDDPQPDPDTWFNNDYCPSPLSFNGGNYDNVPGDRDITRHENRNDNMPKKALTGIIVDGSSDNDAESIAAMSYQGTSSPDSAHNLRKDSCNDPADTFINRKILKKVKEGKSKAADASIGKKSSSSSMVKKEKKGCFITEEAMEQRNRKSPRYIYLMNMIISFILLVAVIGKIVSVLLSVKA